MTNLFGLTFKKLFTLNEIFMNVSLIFEKNFVHEFSKILTLNSLAFLWSYFRQYDQTSYQDFKKSFTFKILKQNFWFSMFRVEFILNQHFYNALLKEKPILNVSYQTLQLMKSIFILSVLLISQSKTFQIV